MTDSSKTVKRVRHAVAPAPNACRWCGVDRQRHAIQWAQSAGYHGWSEPTSAQRKARIIARRS